jgi:hypothetical protein
VALLARVEAEPGRVVTLELDHEPRDFRCTLIARVVYCVALPTGDSLLGCSFLEPLPDDVWDRLG